MEVHENRADNLSNNLRLNENEELRKAAKRPQCGRNVIPIL